MPIKTIDEYIAQFQPDIQKHLQTIRQVIQKAAPDATERMSYGIPTFYLNGNLVHFGMFNQHLGFYPTPSGVEHFKDELKPYKHAKGSIKFPLSKPIPYNLITRITKFRAEQNTTND